MQHHSIAESSQLAAFISHLSIQPLAMIYLYSTIRFCWVFYCTPTLVLNSISISRKLMAFRSSSSSVRCLQLLRCWFGFCCCQFRAGNKQGRLLQLLTLCKTETGEVTLVILAAPQMLVRLLLLPVQGWETQTREVTLAINYLHVKLHKINLNRKKC